VNGNYPSPMVLLKNGKVQMDVHNNGLDGSFPPQKKNGLERTS